MPNAYLAEVPHARKLQFDADGVTRRLRCILDRLYLDASDIATLAAEAVPPAGVTAGAFATAIATTQTDMATLIQAVLACMPVQNATQGA